MLHNMNLVNYVVQQCTSIVSHYEWHTMTDQNKIGPPLEWMTGDRDAGLHHWPNMVMQTSPSKHTKYMYTFYDSEVKKDVSWSKSIAQQLRSIVSHIE